MSETDPAPWHVVQDGFTERYELAPRNIPGARGIAVALAVMGLVCGAIFGSAAMGFFGYFGLIPALVPVAITFGIGALIGWGRSEVHLCEGALVGVEHIGPIRRTRRVERDALERLVVDTGARPHTRRSGGADPLGDFAHLSAIKLDGATGRPRETLVFAHPRATLAALARTLGERLGCAVEVRTLGVAPTSAAAAEESGAPREVPPQPSRSTANLEHTQEGVLLELPPRGFWKGSKGLDAFSLIWLTFVALFGFASLGLGAVQDGAETALPFALGTLLFGAIGVMLFLFALRSGRRRALISVQGRTLSIVQQALGKPNTRIWSGDELAGIGVGPSGITINDVPVLELQVRTHAGKTAGFFRERSDDELFWIAAVLTAALAEPT